MEFMQIAFRGMPPSDAVRSRIEERVQRLLSLDPRITHLHVVVQAAHRSHRQGNLFSVRFQARYPGAAIDVGADARHCHADVYVAVSEAFDAAERQLGTKLRKQDHLRTLNGGPVRGRVARLSSDAGYGFIETETGEDVYFHERNVVDGNFYELDAGDDVYVAFEHRVPGMGDLSPRATTVRPLSKHHLNDTYSER